MAKQQLLREFFLMTLGSVLVAVGIYFFQFPNYFSTGGVTGLSVLLSPFLPGLSPSTLASVANLAFLLLGFLILGKGFGLRTVYCCLLFSALLSLLDHFFPLSNPLTGEKLLELFFAVLLPSFGSAILFNLDSSTGGTDILAMILKKFTSLDIGRALLLCDVVIAASALLIYGAETGLFSLLGLILKSVLVDGVVESLNRRKSFTVITSYPHTACTFITRQLGRGATVWRAEGAYTNEGKYVILAALSRSQAVTLRRYLKLEDPGAFLLIENSSEIFGNGFLRI